MHSLTITLSKGEIVITDYRDYPVLDIAITYTGIFSRKFSVALHASLTHIPSDEYYDFRHFYLTIIAELFIGRSPLRNSTLITSYLTVL